MADNNSCFQIFEGLLSVEEDLHYIFSRLGLGARGGSKGKEDLCKGRKSFQSELSD